MTDIKRKWDLLSKEKREACISDVVDFFEQERDEKIGVLAAEDILDFFLEQLAPDIYNKGVADAKELLKKRFEDLEVDIDLINL